ncbi:hypothetical protein KVT40_009009 [Elsinoe batatas]|uniref:Uncharacterized protein n=1 Tax=Elsinoe batatas TaxID=2601811 RepID=A0A8K0KWS3_9PEZI|nr:hypothetical protein KVT40_009009 [Elsinoe batatas]
MVPNPSGKHGCRAAVPFSTCSTHRGWSRNQLLSTTDVKYHKLHGKTSIQAVEKAKENHSQTPTRIMLQLIITILLRRTILLPRTPLTIIILPTILPPSLIPPPPSPQLCPCPPHQSSDPHPRRPWWMVQHCRSIGKVSVVWRGVSKLTTVVVWLRLVAFTRWICFGMVCLGLRVWFRVCCLFFVGGFLRICI